VGKENTPLAGRLYPAVEKKYSQLSAFYLFSYIINKNLFIQYNDSYL